MKKSLICSMILVALFSGACKSKPAPVSTPASTRVPATNAASGTAAPAATIPGNTTTVTAVPDTSTGSAYGTATPAATIPGNTATVTDVPDTSTGSAYGTTPGTTAGTTSGTIPSAASGTASDTTSETASGTASSSISNRHQSGIILDGAASYTVRRGDTLNGIARQLYRDGSLYPLIHMVSSGIENPDKILPGMLLTIPAVSANMNDPQAKAAIDRHFLQIAQFEDQRGRHRTAEMIRNHTR